MRAIKLFLALLVCCLIAGSHLVYAQYSSPNYSVNEYLFGAGGEQLTSPNYQSQASLGAAGVGDFASANYRSNAGFLTQNTIFLEESVNATNLDLGELSTTSTGYGSATFTVRTYLSQAYSVLTMSQPLTQEEGYQLNPLSSPTASSAGSEQFGINLVKNANFCGGGCDLGADPANQPSNSFADGQAAPGYNTAGLFKYVVGDVIASAPKTTGNQAIGQTQYTISYIANQAPLTRAGTYTMNHDIVVVATF